MRLPALKLIFPIAQKSKMSEQMKIASRKAALAKSVLLATLISTTSYADTFTVGVVPQFDIQTLHKIWSPILQQLENETGHKFQFRGSPDIPTFEKEFAGGVFDFAYMNPYHYTISEHYIPIARDHGRKLFGILAVKADSNIQSPKQLNGATIAFPAPNALGASLMIRSELNQKYGIEFTPKYVKTHSSVFLNVAFGVLPAGGGVQKTFNQQRDDIKKKLKILIQTSKVEPHPLTAKKTLQPEVVASVKDALIKMGQNSEHAALLAKVPFKQIGPAVDADYDGVRALNLDKYYQPPK